MRPSLAALAVACAPAAASWLLPRGGVGARGPPSQLPVGSNAFSAVPEYVRLGGASGAVIAVGDFDGDHSVDVVMLDTGSVERARRADVSE